MKVCVNVEQLFDIGTCNCSVDSGGGGVDVTVAVFFVHQLLLVRVSVRHRDRNEMITLVEPVHEFLTTWQLNFHRLKKIKLIEHAWQIGNIGGCLEIHFCLIVVPNDQHIWQSAVTI